MKKIDPPLMKRISNFSTAVIKHTADGLERLTEEQYLVRLNTCMGNSNTPACEAYNPENSRCRDWRCGCSIKKKAYWRSEDCPQGLWPKIANTNWINPVIRIYSLYAWERFAELHFRISHMGFRIPPKLIFTPNYQHTNISSTNI